MAATVEVKLLTVQVLLLLLRPWFVGTQLQMYKKKTDLAAPLHPSKI